MVARGFLLIDLGTVADCNGTGRVTLRQGKRSAAPQCAKTSGAALRLPRREVVQRDLRSLAPAPSGGVALLPRSPTAPLPGAAAADGVLSARLRLLFRLTLAMLLLLPAAVVGLLGRFGAFAGAGEFVVAALA